MVTLEEVRQEAKQLDPADVGRLIATIIASILYAVGWVLARTVRLLWAAVAWSFAAVRLGWRDGWSVQRSRA